MMADVGPRTWTSRAACRNHPTLPPSTWDGEVEGDRSQKRRQARLAAAVAVCTVCPVRRPCGQEAADGWAGGIRAGDVHPDAAQFDRPSRAGFAKTPHRSKASA